MRTKVTTLGSDIRFRGARITTLRRMDGLTQTELAERLNVTQGFISQIEQDAKPFPVELAQRASTEFALPLRFFAVPADPTEAGVATFRKSSRASVRQEHRVTSVFGEAARLFRIASQDSGYKSTDFTAAVSDDEEDTAANLRSMLGLEPSAPVPNATRAVERLGVGVIHDLVPLDVNSREHDGISRPNALTDRPLIATVGEQPPVAARMTVMHELGHLIYDQNLTAPIRGRRSPEESRAFRFAGAMLIPAAVVQERITETLTLHGYLRVKADYGVSVSALIVRASRLGVISSHRARSLFIQMSSQGWKRNEPVAVAAEKPQLLAQAAQHGISPDPRVIADRTGVRLSQVEQWTGLTIDPSSKSNVILLHRT